MNIFTQDIEYKLRNPVVEVSTDDLSVVLHHTLQQKVLEQGGSIGWLDLGGMMTPLITPIFVFVCLSVCLLVCLLDCLFAVFLCCRFECFCISNLHHVKMAKQD